MATLLATPDATLALPRVRATLRRDVRTAAYAAGATMAIVFLVDALTIGEPGAGQLLPNLVGSALIFAALLVLRGPLRRWPYPVAFAIGMVGVAAAVEPIAGDPAVRYLMLAYYALLTISMAVFMPWDRRWHVIWVGSAFGCLVVVAVSPATAGGPFAEQLMMIGLAASIASVVGHAVLHRRRLRSFAVEHQLRALHQRTMADQLELRRLNTELLAVSRADPLTRVGNRLRFEEDMRLLLSRNAEARGAGALGLLDVDNFKLYNDSFGHLAGDAALRGIADAIGHALRAGDGVYRFGGEEFLVLLPGVDEAGGLRTLDRIREAVAAMALPHPRNAGWGVVTISAGLAMLNPETTPDDWLRGADEALYAAKAAGRNATRAQAA